MPRIGSEEAKEARDLRRGLASAMAMREPELRRARPQVVEDLEVGGSSQQGPGGEEILASFEEDAFIDPLEGGSSQEIERIVEQHGRDALEQEVSRQTKKLMDSPLRGSFEPPKSLEDEEALRKAGDASRGGRKKGIPFPRAKTAEERRHTPQAALTADVRGLQKEKAALIASKKILQKQGDVDAQMFTVKRDYGAGFEETAAEAKERLNREQLERRQEEVNRHTESMNDAHSMSKYPGLSLDNIKKFEGVLDKELSLGDYKNAYEYNNAVKALNREKASAKSNLQKGSQIQADRAFGGIASKVIAALAIGAGAHAAAMGGGRNVALDLYNNAIARDIAAQKEAFAHRRGAPGRAQKEYSFLMDKLGDEDAAELGTLAIKYDTAVQDLRAQAAKFPSLLKSEQYNVALGKLQQQADSAKAQAAKYATTLANSTDTGMTGARYVGMVKYGKEEKSGIADDIWEMRRDSNKVKNAVQRYSDAFKEAQWLPFQEQNAAALAAREALIASLGKLWDKGVLQQFERTEIEKVIPGKYARTEKVLGRLGAVLNELHEGAETNFKAVVDGASHYDYVAPRRRFSGLAGVEATGEKGRLFKSGVAG